MRISTLIGKGIVHEGTIAKLLLNTDVIKNIINEFSLINEKTWVERECLRCKEDPARCKKHKALKALQEAAYCSEIINLGSINSLKLYAAGHAMFVYNEKSRTLLIIDSPPFATKFTKVPSDLWISKIIPFTFGNIDFKVPTVEQTKIDIRSLFSYRALFIPIAKGTQKNLNLHNQRIRFTWEITELIENKQDHTTTKNQKQIIQKTYEEHYKDQMKEAAAKVEEEKINVNIE